MKASLEAFFNAWSDADTQSREDTFGAALSNNIRYSDPRSGNRLQGISSVNDYVGQFSANAPGWRAWVESVDEVNGYARAIVAFGGKGPDGEDMVQHGTYFATADADGKLDLLAGFVGTGQ